MYHCKTFDYRCSVLSVYQVHAGGLELGTPFAHDAAGRIARLQLRTGKGAMSGFTIHLLGIGMSAYGKAPEIFHELQHSFLSQSKGVYTSTLTMKQ